MGVLCFDRSMRCPSKVHREEDGAAGALQLRRYSGAFNISLLQDETTVAPTCYYSEPSDLVSLELMPSSAYCTRGSVGRVSTGTNEVRHSSVESMAVLARERPRRIGVK
eukprot:365665-Chlamydomonas_euryale.AAC.23